MQVSPAKKTASSQRNRETRPSLTRTHRITPLGKRTRSSQSRIMIIIVLVDILLLMPSKLVVYWCRSSIWGFSRKTPKGGV